MTDRDIVLWAQIDLPYSRSQILLKLTPEIVGLITRYEGLFKLGVFKGPADTSVSVPLTDMTDALVLIHSSVHYIVGMITWDLSADEVAELQRDMSADQETYTLVSVPTLSSTGLRDFAGQQLVTVQAQCQVMEIVCCDAGFFFHHSTDNDDHSGRDSSVGFLLPYDTVRDVPEYRAELN